MVRQCAELRPDRQPASVEFYDGHPGSASLREEVLTGLARTPKAIPPKFFYDRRGSELFDAICGLPEYYQTRTEMRILADCVEELKSRVPAGCTLVELGSGASRKVRLLLSELRPAHYLAVDISREFLLESATRLATDFPWLDVHAACVDFTHALDIPGVPRSAGTLAFFPGSSIGNFEPLQAVSLLQGIARLAGPGGLLLIGVDLKKDVATLNAAYNDAQGVTAAFNLNLLRRIQSELDADIDPGIFEHRAFYNPDRGRVEMHLVSGAAHRVRIEDRRFDFETGEKLHTENSYKYHSGEFAALARRAGFRRERQWVDADGLFCVQLLRVRS